MRIGGVGILYKDLNRRKRFSVGFWFRDLLYKEMQVYVE